MMFVYFKVAKALFPSESRGRFGRLPCHHGDQTLAAQGPAGPQGL